MILDGGFAVMSALGAWARASERTADPSDRRRRSTVAERAVPPGSRDGVDAWTTQAAGLQADVRD